MSDEKIVVGAGKPHGPSVVRFPEMGWKILVVVGSMFVLIGFGDIALTWYPLQFGVPEYEFGASITSLNAMPAPTIGLGLLAAAAIGLQHLGLLRVSMAIGALVLLAVLGWGVLFGLTLPMAFQAVDEPMIRTGLKKQAVKALGQALVYAIGYLMLVRLMLKARKAT